MKKRLKRQLMDLTIVSKIFLETVKYFESATWDREGHDEDWEEEAAAARLRSHAAHISGDIRYRVGDDLQTFQIIFPLN